MRNRYKQKQLAIFAASTVIVTCVVIIVSLSKSHETIINFNSTSYKPKIEDIQKKEEVVIPSTTQKEKVESMTEEELILRDESVHETMPIITDKRIIYYCPTGYVLGDGECHKEEITK